MMANLKDILDKKPANYYGSLLNKWVNHKCSRNHTTINIDMFQYKIFYEHDLHIMRFIEYKNEIEGLSRPEMTGLTKAQKEALFYLAEVFRKINNSSLFSNLIIEAYIATGDYNSDFDILRMYDTINERHYVLYQDELKKFFEFEININKIPYV